MEIADAGKHVGQPVELEGWVYNTRSSGKVRFLIVRDGTGFMQVVFAQPAVTAEVLDLVDGLTQESSVIVFGTVRAEQRAPGGHEMTGTSVRVLQRAENYPITPKEHGVDFLLNNRHLWLRSRRPFAIMRIRATVIKAMRDYLDERGFLGLEMPIFTPTSCEGTTSLFAVDYFERTAYLSQSGQLYNEPTAAAFRKVYCLGPTFRAEKSKTRRHLTEFWMLEPEIAFIELPGLLDFIEQFTSHVVARVLETRRDELALLERDPAPLEKAVPPFPRITYDEALALLAKAGKSVTWGDDLGADEETTLSASFDRPVMVTHYPAHAKPFYMKLDPTGKYCQNVDMLAPEGYGEIVGGGQREDDLAVLERRIAEQGLPREPLEWYLDVRRYGSFPHAGFGMGVERVVAWICKLAHLREAIPFPRLLDRLTP